MVVIDNVYISSNFKGLKNIKEGTRQILTLTVYQKHSLKFYLR